MTHAFFTDFAQLVTVFSHRDAGTQRFKEASGQILISEQFRSVGVNKAMVMKIREVEFLWIENDAQKRGIPPE
jgi:hypothetical protein